MQQDKPMAKIGDPMPNVILPDAQGNGIGLSQQVRAGRWQVLVFTSPETVRSGAEALTAFKARMEAVEGLLFTVALTPPNDAVPADLFDDSQDAARFLLGGNTEGIAVISPEPRLAATFDIEGLEDAVRFCEDAFAVSPTGLAEGFAPVLVIENVLDDELVARIMEYWGAEPQVEDNVASTQVGNDAYDNTTKRRTDVVVKDGPLFNEIKAAVGRRINPLLERAFRMKVASMEAPRIGCYRSENQGTFDRHRDNTTPFTAHRKFAVTMNLNTGEYEGGEVRFPEYGRRLYNVPKGAAVVFSCALLHEALPVTSGERFGMFTFLTDAEGLEQEKEMVERIKAERAKQNT